MSSRPPHPFADNPDPSIVIDKTVAHDLESWWRRHPQVHLDEADLFRLLIAIQRMAGEADVGWEWLPPVDGHDPNVTRYDGPHTIGPVTFTLQYVRLRPLGRDMLLVIGMKLAYPPDA